MGMLNRFEVHCIHVQKHHNETIALYNLKNNSKTLQRLFNRLLNLQLNKNIGGWWNGSSDK
jgi:hypothetical protein